MTTTPSPNAEHVQVWNEILVPKFRRFRQVLTVGFAGHSDFALQRFPVHAGERVLDVGCGFGETSLELARMVGPTGFVLGNDCCDGFIDTAKADAAQAGLDNVKFEVADAQSQRFDGFNVCFSRFGTMFFQNPVAALRNLRASLMPGGRLQMIVWRSIDDNAWLSVPKRIAREHLPPPADEAPSCGPGPFSMANADTVRELVSAAGFTDITLTRNDAIVNLGPDVDAAMAFQLALGPAGEIMREAGALGEQKRPLIEAQLRAALAEYVTPQGVLTGSSSWCVMASRR